MNITPSARSGNASAPSVQTEREKRLKQPRREAQEQEARKQEFQQVYSEEDDDEEDFAFAVRTTREVI